MSDLLVNQVDEILKKMCEFAGVDFLALDSSKRGWLGEVRWPTIRSQVMFVRWLAERFYADSSMRNSFLPVSSGFVSRASCFRWAVEFCRTFGFKPTEDKEKLGRKLWRAKQSFVTKKRKKQTP